MTENWHVITGHAAMREAKTDITGLSEPEAERRLERDGANKLAEGEKTSLFGIFISQFQDLMIWVLIAAAVVSAVAPLLTEGHADITDAAIIIPTSVLLSANIEFILNPP